MPGMPYEWQWPVDPLRLTGRRRYRQQKWTGRLVLEIELGGPEVHFLSGKANGRERFWWRDATMYDLQTIPFSLVFDSQSQDKP